MGSTDEYRYYYGYLTFENFWGKDIKNVTLRHQSKVFWYVRPDVEVFNHVPSKAILVDCFAFKYHIGIGEDTWEVNFETDDGEVYQSTTDFSCNITESDKGRVIVGLNGDSQRLYVSFPSSSGCSTGITRV